MQQPQGLFQHGEQHRERRAFVGGIIVQPNLRRLDVPVAELVPQEIPHAPAGLAILEGLQRPCHLVGEPLQATEDPAIFQQQLAQARFGLLQVVQDEAPCLPEFVGKIARSLDAAHVQVHVVAGRGGGHQRVAQRIGPILVNDVKRVVFPRIGHGFADFLAALVADKAVQVHGGVRRLVQQRQREHRLARYPEEEDVIAGLTHVVGEETLQIRRVPIGPAKRGEGPQPGREPRVEHILVLADGAAAALGTAGRIFQRAPLLAAIVAVPDRNAMAPPQLPADAPVADVLHPMEPHLLKMVGDDAHRPVAHDLHRLRRERPGADEPLSADARLDDGVAPLTVAHRVLIRFHFNQQSFLLKVGDDGPPTLVALQSRVGTGGRVHQAGGRHHVNLREVMAQANLVIGGIVRRRDLDRARAELRQHSLVRHDGNLTPERGQHGDLSH
ncbi:MAG: hypothetical protein BWY25_02203 [Chloroflexi bacterium ADurb.Bin222]|nr:MAG: hypothetical protein BWY25_02203 [Chloroflexi bacterium ADurb.Bin222]